jgi:hypothetical protein
MPVDPAQLQALDQHESNKKVGEIPQFHGIPAKDQLTAKQMITKIERAANICNWNDAAKAQRLANALKGPAYTWYEGLKRSHRLNPEDWNVLRKHFLKQYEKLVTASILTRSLKDIQMKPNETVSEYNDRSQAVFNEYYDQYIDKACKLDEVTHAGNVAANHPLMTESMKTAAQLMMIFMQMTLYEAGLLDYIRLEVATKTYENLMDLQTAAADAEARHSTKKVTLHAIEQDDDEDDEGAEVHVLEEEEYDTIAVLYKSRGKKMPAFFRKGYNRMKQQQKKNNGNSAASRLTKEQKALLECWHCGYKGHVISECRQKQAGKPKNPNAGPKKKVNAADAAASTSTKVDSIRTVSLNY